MAFDVLLIGERELRDRVATQLDPMPDFRLTWVRGRDEALGELEQGLPNLILVDADMPESEGLKLARRLASMGEPLRVVTLTADSSVETAVKAMKLGVVDHIVLPQAAERLDGLVREALAHWEQERRREALLREQRSRYSFENIIGRSRRMEKVFEISRKVIESNATTVLIRGETGTGKELLARAIHYNSSRSEGAFVELNCSAIPDTLLEAELFGYERGAFTDARGRKKGLFELAHEGTIFLDEIGFMSLGLQVKLLKVIEEKRVRRLGGTADVRVDTRVIAATNRDLEDAIGKGAFREDLYYRLNVIGIELPPLRQRGDDVILLARHFTRHFCREHGRELKVLSPRAEDHLRRHRWPGNVRELKNAVERAVLLGEGRIIVPEHICVSVRSMVPLDSPDASDGDKLMLTVGEEGIPLDEAERKVILATLRAAGWNRSKASRMLRIPRPRLLRKIAKYGLKE
jgi:two-component system response regulator AtoC